MIRTPLWSISKPRDRCWPPPPAAAAPSCCIERSGVGAEGRRARGRSDGAEGHRTSVMWVAVPGLDTPARWGRRPCPREGCAPRHGRAPSEGGAPRRMLHPRGGRRRSSSKRRDACPSIPAVGHDAAIRVGRNHRAMASGAPGGAPSRPRVVASSAPDGIVATVVHGLAVGASMASLFPLRLLCGLIL